MRPLMKAVCGFLELLEEPPKAEVPPSHLAADVADHGRGRAASAEGLAVPDSSVDFVG